MNTIFEVVLERKIFPINLFLIFLLIFTAIPKIYAQGDLLVYPTRLVFEGTQDRVKILNLNNKGKDTAVYQLSYIENKMDGEGRLSIIQESEKGISFASPYLRFYPRTVTLAPGETQIIKVQLIKSGDLAAGEYRSHLYFRSVPRTEEIHTKEGLSSDPNGIKIQLKPVFGLSIANIIRIGNPEAHIDLSNLDLQKEAGEAPILSLIFNRRGTASSYGDLKVIYIAPDGRETEVAKMQGIGVYTPGEFRKTSVKLKVVEGVDYSSGKLKVSYVSQGTGKTNLAETSLSL